MAFDREIASYTIFCEASSEDHTARLGVACCLFNRLATAKFGETIAEICLKRMQFSEWNADQNDNLNLLRAARAPDRDPVMVDCGIAFDQAQFKSIPDPTHGATHYIDDRLEDNPPAWTIGAIQTVKLGRLIFYRGIR